jgi:hypothetical protein
MRYGPAVMPADVVLEHMTTDHAVKNPVSRLHHCGPGRRESTQSRDNRKVGRTTRSTSR